MQLLARSPIPLIQKPASVYSQTANAYTYNWLETLVINGVNQRKLEFWRYFPRILIFGPLCKTTLQHLDLLSNDQIKKVYFMGEFNDEIFDRVTEIAKNRPGLKIYFPVDPDNNDRYCQEGDNFICCSEEVVKDFRQQIKNFWPYDYHDLFPYNKFDRREKDFLTYSVPYNRSGITRYIYYERL